MSSTIAVTTEVRDGLLEDGAAEFAHFSPRDDGRWNLRLGDELRAKLDRYVVLTGLSHSEVLARLRILANSGVRAPTPED